MPTPRVSGSFPVPVVLTLAQRIRRFWDPPDDFLLDAGKAGELLIARIRLGVLLGLLMIPLSNGGEEFVVVLREAGPGNPPSGRG